MKDWREQLGSKLISAEKAASFVKSGDCVAFTAGREAHAIGLSIAGRKSELKNVTLKMGTPSFDFGWYDEGWDDAFNVGIRMPTALCQDAVDARRLDITPTSLIPFWEMPGAVDVLLTEISTPDEKGFCSFGASIWTKKDQVRAAKLVIAEVNPNLIRTFGDNFIHFSEIDYFVEHVASGASVGSGTLAGRQVKEAEPHVKAICGHVSKLINDGDTIQIGVGRTSEPLIKQGLLNGKNDIGVHSEATAPGIIGLVKSGVINGKRKTLNPEIVVVTSIGGGSREEMDWVNENPLFHLRDVRYVEDPRIIGAHDNLIAINNALMVDLGGQIDAVSLGTRTMSVAGGQIAFVIGAWLAKGGRSVTVLPATAKDGTVSRIVPSLPFGTTVTVPRNCADYIVTEFGVAHLKGKSLRQRAEALIAIAHPKFREELTAGARKLYWP